jgi:hypothetical protein
MGGSRCSRNVEFRQNCSWVAFVGRISIAVFHKVLSLSIHIGRTYGSGNQKSIHEFEIGTGGDALRGENPFVPEDVRNATVPKHSEINFYAV